MFYPGWLWKRGFHHKSWKERWFVLTPHQLVYYTAPELKHEKGAVVFDEKCLVEVYNVIKLY